MRKVRFPERCHDCREWLGPGQGDSLGGRLTATIDRQMRVLPPWLTKEAPSYVTLIRWDGAHSA